MLYKKNENKNWYGFTHILFLRTKYTYFVFKKLLQTDILSFIVENIVQTLSENMQQEKQYPENKPPRDSIAKGYVET